MENVLERDFNSAVKEIEFLIKLKAQEKRAYGWSFYLSNEAPETYKELLEYADSMVIPINCNGSSSSIYSKPHINTLFRFWHDVIHIEEGLGFTLMDEGKVADIHIEEGREFGLSSLALQILEADTKGQVEYYYKHNKFVDNQKAFVQSCLRIGIRNSIRFPH